MMNFFLTFQTNHSVLWGYIAKGGREIFFLRCLLLNGVYYRGLLGGEGGYRGINHYLGNFFLSGGRDFFCITTWVTINTCLFL